MNYYVGIDVSLELSSVCILDASGQIMREAKVASEPEALATFLANLNLTLTRVGLREDHFAKGRPPPSFPSMGLRRRASNKQALQVRVHNRCKIRRVIR